MKKILMVTVNFPPSTSIGTQRILKILKFIDKKKFTPYVLTQKIHYFKESIDPFDPYVKKIITPIKILRTKKVNLNNTLLHLRDRIKSTQKLKKKKNGDLGSKHKNQIGNNKKKH